MPIYEYQCEKCHWVFENLFMHPVRGKKNRCPVCGGIGLRIMSASNFRLRGSGFYATDYKPKGRVYEEND
jgi:putative FmdB family regulatory protein